MPPHPPTYDDDLRARNERKKGNGGTGLREGLIGFLYNAWRREKTPVMSYQCDTDTGKNNTHFEKRLVIIDVV